MNGLTIGLKKYEHRFVLHRNAITFLQRFDRFLFAFPSLLTLSVLFKPKKLLNDLPAKPTQS